MYDRPFRALPGVFLVEYPNGQQGEFFVALHWRDKRGTYVFRKHFTREYVFGDSCKNPDEGTWRVKQRVCRFGKDVIQDVLTHRGL